MKQLIKNIKNAWYEDPQEMRETIAYAITIFAGLYIAIWVGNALGLQ